MEPGRPRTLSLHPAGLLLLLASCMSSASSRPAEEPELAGHPLLVVSNEVSGDLTLLDPSTDTVVATIPVGKRPRGIRVGAAGRAYVALSGSPRSPPGVDPRTLPPPDRSADGIGVVDLQTRELVRVLPSGQDPECFDLGRDGARLYVSNEETAEVSVVDLSTGAVVLRVPVGEEPEGVTTRPDGQVVYVTSESDDHVSVIDTRTEQVLARIPTAARPRAVAFTPDGSKAFVTAENAGAITVIDARSHLRVGEILLQRAPATATSPDAAAPGPPAAGAPADLRDSPPRPMGAALSPDGSTLYVTNGRAGSVSVIDTATSEVVRTIEGVGARPWGIAVSPDGRRLYTANGPSDDLSVIDAASGEVLKRIPVGQSPWGVAFAR